MYNNNQSTEKDDDTLSIVSASMTEEEILSESTIMKDVIVKHKKQRKKKKEKKNKKREKNVDVETEEHESETVINDAVVKNKKQKKKKKKKKTKKKRKIKTKEDSETEEYESEHETEERSCSTEFIGIDFEPHKKNEWGLVINFDDWKVEEVEPDLQADTLGVCVGWKVVKYNNKKVDALNAKKIKKKIQKKKSCKLGFESKKVDDENECDYICIDVAPSDNLSIDRSNEFNDNEIGEAKNENQADEEPTNWLKIMMIIICVIAMTIALIIGIKYNCVEASNKVEDLEKNLLQGKDLKQECKDALSIAKNQLLDIHTLLVDPIDEIYNNFIKKCAEATAKEYIAEEFKQFYEDYIKKKKKITDDQAEKKYIEDQAEKKRISDMKKRNDKILEEKNPLKKFKEKTLNEIQENIDNIMEKAIADKYATDCNKYIKAEVDEKWNIFNENEKIPENVDSMKMKEDFVQELAKKFKQTYDDYRNNKIEEKVTEILKKIRLNIYDHIVTKLSSKFNDWIEAKKTENAEKAKENEKCCQNICRRTSKVTESPKITKEVYNKIIEDFIEAFPFDFCCGRNSDNNEMLKQKCMESQEKELSSIRNQCKENFKEKEFNKLHDDLTKQKEQYNRKFWKWWSIVLLGTCIFIMVFTITICNNNENYCCNCFMNHYKIGWKDRYPVWIKLKQAIFPFISKCAETMIFCLIAYISVLLLYKLMNSYFYDNPVKKDEADYENTLRELIDIMPKEIQ